MPAAVLFYSLLFLLLVVVPSLLILIVLMLFEHERRLWVQLAPSLGPRAMRMGERPSLQRLRRRYPRTVDFIGRRLDRHNPWGLSATIAAGAIIIGLWFFLGVIQDLVDRDPLVMLDRRLHNSMALFRSPAMTGFMLAVTQLGSAAVLLLLCAGSALIARSRGRGRLAVAFILAIAGSGLLSLVLRTLFGYARPSDALIAAHEASFPSGHMLSSTVVYGLMASRLLSGHARRSHRAVGATLLLLLIVGIGLSRLYLGVHWPSDLLGSLAVALICLALLLFFLHYGRPLPRIDQVTLPFSPSMLHRLGVALLLAVIPVAALIAARTPIRAAVLPPPGRPVLREQLLAGIPGDIPRRSEDLIGGKMEPVSLVLIGSQQSLMAAFVRAGWTRADMPTPVRIMKEGLAALANRPDPSGPATPAFLDDRPQTLTFEKPDVSSPGIRRRHHTRIWQTPYCVTPACAPIWVATASFDVGLELSARLHLPTHRIDPRIDAERALIARDLIAAGARKLGVIPAVPPFSGKNAAGDPFVTDGQAVVLELSPASVAGLYSGVLERKSKLHGHDSNE